MKRKNIIKYALMALLVIVISASLVFGIPATTDDYKPNFGASYTGPDQGGVNVGERFLDFLAQPFYNYDKIKDENDADLYNWYEGAFFGLAVWEREVCAMTATSEIAGVANDATPIDDVVYTTTYTVSAQKSPGINASVFIYEISWYIMPYGSDAMYKVYFEKGSDKIYFAGNRGTSDSTWDTVSDGMGDQGYEVRDDIIKEYTHVILEYKYPGSNTLAGSMKLPITGANALGTGDYPGGSGSGENNPSNPTNPSGPSGPSGNENI